MKRLATILSIAGIIMLFMSLQEGVASLRPHVDLYGDTTNVSEIGYFDMVDAEVYAVFDCFASEEVTKNSAKVDEHFFYIVPAFNGDDMYYIGVKVNDKTWKTYDQLIDITYEYLMGYTDEIGDVSTVTTGCLKKMDSKVKKYYYEWFEEMEWFDSEEEMNTYALPVYIDSIARPEAPRIMLFAGIAMTVIGVPLLIVLLVKGGSRTKKAKNQDVVIINGISYPKSTFSHVNTSIQSQERIFAAQEIHEITGISLEEAGQIVENWDKIYY